MGIPKLHRMPFTYDDYKLLDDGRRVELIDGDFMDCAAPNPRHQTVSKRIEMELIRQLEARRRGEIFHSPIDVVFTKTDVVQPDILFIRKQRLGIVGKEAIEGPPDLVIEILSPGSHRMRDLDIKRKLYWRRGVREYWIVDPDAETIEVLVWDESRYRSAAVVPSGKTLRSPSVKGLRIATAKIFRR